MESNDSPEIPGKRRVGFAGGGGARGRERGGGVGWGGGAEAEISKFPGLFSGLQSTKGQLIQSQANNVQHRIAAL